VSARKTKTELADLSPDELKAKEKELKENLLHARIQHTMGQLENTMRLREFRRDIARVKTLLRLKERSG
jgi:large subunit ribosomal protein L29